jgi:ankyrin repeat protein
MHAVLESALEDSMNNEAQKVRNHALIHYLASLANSNNNDDIFDFDFVQSLIHNGADVNCTDKNGQTIFHEVARSWNLDVALFLLENGKHINCLGMIWNRTYPLITFTEQLLLLFS